MCRWYNRMSFSVVPSGIARKLGSPHQGLRRSPSWSKGLSSLRATPAVETSATVHSRSGFASGLRGITPGSSRSAHAFIICRVAKSTKRYESMAIRVSVDRSHAARRTADLDSCEAGARRQQTERQYRAEQCGQYGRRSDADAVG